MTIKYLASYSGPSYGSMTQERMDGFNSLKDAMQAMWRRQDREADTVVEYLENPNGVHQFQGESYVRFPATTREDIMDVYDAVWDKELEGYILGDWMYRITVGPRGGIRSEKA